MDVKEAIYGRRSVRKYKDTPISDADMEEIVNAGLMAPSATNIQPWYFVAVNKPESMEELRKIAKEGTVKFRSMLEERFPNHPEVVEKTINFIAKLGDAPAVVLAFMRRPEDGESIVEVQGISAALQNMSLMAYSKGIGSCWLTSLYRAGAGPVIRERFAPEKGSFIALMTFGYSDEESKAPKRKDDRAVFI